MGVAPTASVFSRCCVLFCGSSVVGEGAATVSLDVCLCFVFSYSLIIVGRNTAAMCVFSVFFVVATQCLLLLCWYEHAASVSVGSFDGVGT